MKYWSGMTLLEALSTVNKNARNKIMSGSVTVDGVVEQRVGTEMHGCRVIQVDKLRLEIAFGG